MQSIAFSDALFRIHQHGKPVFSGNMVYLSGFGRLESRGPNHVKCAEDMYENGNKIDIMG